MRKGMIKIQVTPSTVQDNGIYLQITATNPSNPIRNIRVIMPGFEHTAERMPFHPLFLDSIRKYKTLRFMDWALTNNAQDVEFSNRTRPNFVSQAWRGVSLEYMILLPNMMKASPWFCIPHTASDDYISKYASLVKRTLQEDVQIFLEHSNEV
jgi:hypothetical protein